VKIEKIRDTLNSGGLVIGGEVIIMESPAIAEIYAAAGFDFIMIDNEHTALDLSQTVEIVRVANLCKIAPFVRVPEIEYHIINRLLDQGVKGIVIPRVTGKEQVIKVLDMMRYYPQGERGWGPSGSCTGYGDFDPEKYIDHANKSIMLVIQIESKDAIKDIDSIVSIPGVDVALIGANDLSLTAEKPCQLYDKEVVSLMQKVVDKCREYGITSGIAGYDINGYLDWIKAGMQFFWVANEVQMILSEGQKIVKKLRDFHP